MAKFIDVATEGIFGVLWTRPGLDLKTRTLVCVVSDAATGRYPELDIHLRFALRQGWTEEELTEVLLHLVGYVGAPVIRDAMMVASEVFEKVKAEAAVVATTADNRARGRGDRGAGRWSTPAAGNRGGWRRSLPGRWRRCRARGGPATHPGR